TSRTVTFSGAGTIAGAFNTTINSGLSGSGPLTKLESGTLTLTADNASYTGAVTIGAPGPVPVGSTLVSSSGAGGITLCGGGRPNPASSITVHNSQLLAVLRGASTLTAADRLGTVPITLNGGMLTYSPGAAAAESTTTLGALTLIGMATLRTDGVAGDAAGTQLSFGAFTRADRATLILGANTTGNGQMGGAP